MISLIKLDDNKRKKSSGKYSYLSDDFVYCYENNRYKLIEPVSRTKTDS